MRNYQEIKHNLINGLLRDKKTSILSAKMGFTFDKVKRWRDGSKQLRWNEFCDLCIRLNAPLFHSLSITFGFPISNTKDAYRVISHLKVYAGKKSVAVLAKELGVSLSVFQRYVRSSIYPDIELVLEMMDMHSNFLDHFIENLLKIKDLQEVSIFSNPLAGAVSNAVGLPEHQKLSEHSSKWIASFLGLSVMQIEEALSFLVSLKLIEKDGQHYRPTLARTIAVYNSINTLDYSRFIRFWMRRAEFRFQTQSGVPINKLKGPNRDLFRTFATGPETASKITDIINKAEQEVHDLLSNSKEEKSDVRVLLFHHFSAQDF